jgi:hypothetical protein
LLGIVNTSKRRRRIVHISRFFIHPSIGKRCEGREPTAEGNNGVRQIGQQTRQ